MLKKSLTRTYRVLKRPSLDIAFTTEALKANLSRLRDEWENYQATRDRDGIYRYLEAVFMLVAWWARESKVHEYAQRALRLQRPPVPNIVDPFAAIIFCTADPEKVDFRTRSKWACVLRYAKVFKDPDETLIDFVRRRGGINRCVRRYSRQLGRSSRTGD
jgi:hypothetical protein